MRTVTLFLSLVSCAAPAFGQPIDDADRQSRRAAREQSDSESQRAERSERRVAREQLLHPLQVNRHQVETQRDDGMVAAMRDRHQPAQRQSQSAPIERDKRYEERQAQGDALRTDRLQQYRQRQFEVHRPVESGGLVPRQSRIRTIPTTPPEAGAQSPVRHDVRVGTRHDRDDRYRWTSHWRNDQRYDWRRHRDRHRSRFHIGFYYDPFGYSYSRFGIGSYLYPTYYRSSFWITDPWYYRLPPAYGPYRWVRYHNDAILIDTWTGEVVDVIYGFFW